MATYRKWSELKAKMSPQSLAEIEHRKAQLMAEIPLEQLRAARQLTQTNLAQVLGPVPRGTNQPSPTSPIPTEDCTQDLLAREHAAAPAGESESWD